MVLVDDTEPAFCIGCGCDDMQACCGETGEPCNWLVYDRHDNLGVCSSCPDDVGRFLLGERQVAVFI